MLIACSGSDDTLQTPSSTDDTSLTDTLNNADPSTVQTPEACTYPTHDGFAALGKVMPPLLWSEARTGAGSSVGPLSLEDVYCNPAYDDVSVIVVYLTAEWCTICAAEIRDAGLEGTFNAWREAGALVIVNQTERLDLSLSDTPAAFDRGSALASNLEVFIVGDGDTEPRLDVASVITRSPLVRTYPAGFIVRKRDMVIISTLQEGGLPVDVPGIASDPEVVLQVPSADSPRCGAMDEEVGEPMNNSAGSPVAITLNDTLSGGICDASPDFVQVAERGAWRLELSFDAQVGDLDVFLWDTDKDSVALDRFGRRIGSDGLDSVEVVEGCGPSVLQVVGASGQTGPYELTLSMGDPGACDSP